MAPLKHLSISISDVTLIKLSQIYDETLANYKMYAILSIEKYFFLTETMKAEGDFLNFAIKNEKNSFSIKMPLEEGKHVVASPLPMDRMMIDENDTIAASETLIKSHQSDIDFRVEYIGISEDCAIHRLSNGHKTLQKILADFHDKETNRDLYIALFNAGHFEVNTLDAKSAKIKIQDIDIFLNNVYSDDNKITALCEACLINLMKPEYNLEYKSATKDKKFETLKSLYDYGYKAASITIFAPISRGFDYRLTLWTKTSLLTFEQSNGFKVVKECPFVLTN